MNKVMRGLTLRTAAMLCGTERGKIVFYHDVFKTKERCALATPLSLFCAHCDVVDRMGYSFVGRTPTSDKTVQVCFDDGYRGVYECKDEMIARGVFPTVYLAVEFIGKPDYLTRTEILELQDAGFSFQSHTWSHGNLTDCDKKSLNHELCDSKKWLSDFLQKEVTQICFPRGVFSMDVYNRSLEAGYRELMSSIPGAVDQGMMLKLLPRNLVQNFSAVEYGLVLRGALSLFRKHYFARHFKD